MIDLTKDSPIPPYMAFPRFLLKTDLNDTARIVYMLLLDRSRISQKNEGWQDDFGAVYVIFPIDDLAAAIHRSRATVKTALSVLEDSGLISRQRQGTGRANHIYVRIPADSGSAVTGTEPLPPDSKETAHFKVRKPATNNNYRSNIDPINNQRENHAVYGEYQNVLLTEQDIQDLKETVPGYREYIDALSEYMAASGKKYKNHAAAIKSWARREKGKRTYSHDMYCYEEGDSL